MTGAAGELILAIDQGTSSTKCLLIDRRGAVVATGSAPLGEHHPQPGWVEQDGLEIWASVQAAVGRCMEGQDARRVAGIGIANQRESVLVWDRRMGQPVSPLVSWQDQRTGRLCDGLRSEASEALVRARSGLPLDPMFSAAKASWLLDELDGGRVRARSGDLVIGTVDAWLLACLGGEPVCEAGNASRTQLMDVRKLAWDAELLELFRVPRAALPRITASTGPFPVARGLAPLPDGVPVLAVLGDSHAALFGHGARSPGQTKATYGTGSSVMGLIARPEALGAGVCLTLAWVIGDRPAFAAEGNIRAAGSTLRWVAEILEVTPDALASLGADVASDGVSLVPGFGGLGAPWWDKSAVGVLTGLHLGTSRAAIARAALESIPHQVSDMLDAIDAGVGEVGVLFADGGPTRNDALMQMQADLAGRDVVRSRTAELSALGAAHLAGLVGGLWSEGELAARPSEQDRFAPTMSAATRTTARGQWQVAVARARGQQVPRPV